MNTKVETTLKNGVWKIKDGKAELLGKAYEWPASPEEISKVLAQLDEHEKTQHHIYAMSFSQRVYAILQHYKDVGASGITSAKAARDNMLTWLRAMAIVADMTANAGTHGEKNARLRGMIDVIESAAEKLQNETFDFSKQHWNMSDIFKSDYPIRYWTTRTHHAEDRVKKLEEKVMQFKIEKAVSLGFVCTQDSAAGGYTVFGPDKTRYQGDCSTREQAWQDAFNDRNFPVME